MKVVSSLLNEKASKFQWMEKHLKVKYFMLAFYVHCKDLALFYANF